MSEDAEVVEEEFAVTLEGDGVSIDKKVDRQTALAVMSAIMGGAAPMMGAQPTIQANHSGFAESNNPNSPPTSMREFISQSTASTNTEHIATIGLYFRLHKGQDTFTRDDVRAGFRSAHEPLPKNISRDMSTTIKAGWIEEAEEAGSYYVTNTGTKKVEDRFGRGAK